MEKEKRCPRCRSTTLTRNNNKLLCKACKYMEKIIEVVVDDTNRFSGGGQYINFGLKIRHNTDPLPQRHVQSTGASQTQKILLEFCMREYQRAIKAALSRLLQRSDNYLIHNTDFPIDESQDQKINLTKKSIMLSAKKIWEHYVLSAKKDQKQICGIFKKVIKTYRKLNLQLKRKEQKKKEQSERQSDSEDEKLLSLTNQKNHKQQQSEQDNSHQTHNFLHRPSFLQDFQGNSQQEKKKRQRTNSHNKTALKDHEQLTQGHQNNLPSEYKLNRSEVNKFVRMLHRNEAQQHEDFQQHKLSEELFLTWLLNNYDQQRERAQEDSLCEGRNQNKKIYFLSQVYCRLVLHYHKLKQGKNTTYSKTKQNYVSLKELRQILRIRNLYQANNKDEIMLLILFDGIIRTWAKNKIFEGQDLNPEAQQLTLKESIRIYHLQPSEQKSPIVDIIISQLDSILGKGLTQNLTMNFGNLKSKKLKSEVFFQLINPPELSYSLIYSIINLALLANRQTFSLLEIINGVGYFRITPNFEQLIGDNKHLEKIVLPQGYLANNENIKPQKIRNLSSWLFKYLLSTGFQGFWTSRLHQRPQLNLDAWVRRTAIQCGLQLFLSEITQIARVFWNHNQYKHGYKSKSKTFRREDTLKHCLQHTQQGQRLNHFNIRSHINNNLNTNRNLFLEQDIHGLAIVIAFLKLHLNFDANSAGDNNFLINCNHKLLKELFPNLKVRKPQSTNLTELFQNKQSLIRWPIVYRKQLDIIRMMKALVLSNSKMQQMKKVKPVSFRAYRDLDHINFPQYFEIMRDSKQGKGVNFPRPFHQHILRLSCKLVRQEKINKATVYLNDHMHDQLMAVWSFQDKFSKQLLPPQLIDHPSENYQVYTDFQTNAELLNKQRLIFVVKRMIGERAEMDKLWEILQWYESTLVNYEK